mmetsp:Transcript_34480/g.93450  ORF Transcript_34480/g.93450 Transcript_34480/m.93450 type:complete len:294 (-) Transcript_34480:121-1002(-)
MTSPSMFSDTLWRLQSQLRKNSILLPGVLLLISSILVLHEHMTSDRLDLRTFLTLVLATMVPLAYIDAVISSRSDPIGLLCTFGGRVLLMHVSFLLLRFRLFWYPGVFYLNLQNVIGFFCGSTALVIGYVPLLGAKDVKNIGIILMLAISAAITTELVTWGFHLAKTFRRELTLEILGTASEYAEILAFVPAVWTVFASGKKDAAPMQVKPEVAKAAVLAFFTFLMGFYLFEDIVTAVFTFQDDTVAAFAHVLHFLLLGDVSTFLVMQVFNPDKANATMLQRMSDAFMGDCNV